MLITQDDINFINDRLSVITKNIFSLSVQLSENEPCSFFLKMKNKQSISGNAYLSIVKFIRDYLIKDKNFPTCEISTNLITIRARVINGSYAEKRHKFKPGPIIPQSKVCDLILGVDSLIDNDKWINIDAFIKYMDDVLNDLKNKGAYETLLIKGQFVSLYHRIKNKKEYM